MTSSKCLKRLVLKRQLHEAERQVKVKRIDMPFPENADEQNASPRECVRVFVTFHFKKTVEITHLKSNSRRLSKLY